LDTPLISVILPFFNDDSTIAEAIESIIHQTYTNFELLLINNNSKDNSRHISERFKDKDPRIKIIHESQQGIAHSLNKGIIESKGLYIARMDADDYSYPNRLEQQLLTMQKDATLDLLGTAVNYKSRTSQSEGIQYFIDWQNSLTSFDEIKTHSFVESPIVHPTFFFKKSSIEKFGSYLHGDFPEDYELILRWLSYGAKIKKIKEIYLDWFDSDQRLTRTDSRYSEENFFKIKSRYLAKWLKENNPNHPHVLIWGAGKKAKAFSNLLTNYDIKITGYIDVDPQKSNNSNIIFYKDLTYKKEHFILSYVGNRSARNKISDFLSKSGYENGKNYLLIN
jgi:glycosyltransferase involved in cell wall biosynthesis